MHRIVFALILLTIAAASYVGLDGVSIVASAMAHQANAIAQIQDE